jgi:hypothetical protein
MSGPVKCAVVVALSLSLAAGCATTEQNQQLGGAAVGGLAGGLLCTALHGNTAACLASAAAGAAIGWGTVKVSQYRSAQVRSSQSDNRIYGLTAPPDSTSVVVRKSSAVPQSVQPGQEVNVSTDYSVILPHGTSQVDVVESWALTKDGKVLANLAQPPVQRSAGGYVAQAGIPIPGNAPHGTYVIEHKVQAGTVFDSQTSVFYVGAG